MANDENRPPLSLLLHGKPHSRTKRIERHVRNGGKVVKVPCPDGSVTLIGIAPDGKWVAEWRCLEADWREIMIDRMVLHVRHSKAVGIPRLRKV